MNKPNHKTIFIIDPVRGERIHLAKFIKHECFMVLTFTAIQDCFKMMRHLTPDLIVYALRKKGPDIKKLQNIKRKYKKLDLILSLTTEVPEINTAELQESGFTSIFKASTQEKIREISHELLSPETLPRRSETPHPVPFYIAENPTLN